MDGSVSSLSSRERIYNRRGYRSVRRRRIDCTRFCCIVGRPMNGVDRVAPMERNNSNDGDGGDDDLARRKCVLLYYAAIIDSKDSA